MLFHFYSNQTRWYKLSIMCERKSITVLHIKYINNSGIKHNSVTSIFFQLKSGKIIGIHENKKEFIMNCHKNMNAEHFCITVTLQKLFNSKITLPQNIPNLVLKFIVVFYNCMIKSFKILRLFSFRYSGV